MSKLKQKKMIDVISKKKIYSKPDMKRIGRINTITAGTPTLNNLDSGGLAGDGS